MVLMTKHVHGNLWVNASLLMVNDDDGNADDKDDLTQQHQAFDQ